MLSVLWEKYLKCKYSKVSLAGVLLMLLEPILSRCYNNRVPYLRKVLTLRHVLSSYLKLSSSVRIICLVI